MFIFFISYDLRSWVDPYNCIQVMFYSGNLQAIGPAGTNFEVSLENTIVNLAQNFVGVISTDSTDSRWVDSGQSGRHGLDDPNNWRGLKQLKHVACCQWIEPLTFETTHLQQHLAPFFTTTVHSCVCPWLMVSIHFLYSSTRSSHLRLDRPGSNNTNFLVPSGQFGTRLQGGKDGGGETAVETVLRLFGGRTVGGIDMCVGSGERCTLHLEGVWKAWVWRV